jgi:hypothetical protein
MSLLLWMLTAFCVTMATEIAISLLFRSRRLCYAVLLGNLLTNPALNLVLLIYLYLVGQSGYFTLLVILELVVIVVEAIVIHLVAELIWPKAFGLSVLFNTVSFLVGMLLW